MKGKKINTETLEDALNSLIELGKLNQRIEDELA